MATNSDARRIYNFADKPERLAMSLPAFLDFAGGLSHHLHMQCVAAALLEESDVRGHQIEECVAACHVALLTIITVHLFPLWGQRIPAFNEAENGDRAVHAN